MESAILKGAIESILFVSHKNLGVKELSSMLGAEKPAVEQALAELTKEKEGSGVVILESNRKYQLATNSKNSTLVKNFLNAELREKLTEATLEVLAIISYRQPISKAEIEAIRGVNSQYSLRILLMRGLIEKIPNPKDQRSLLYQTTSEFLMHLGLTSVKELEAFEKVSGEVKLPETPNLENEKPDQPEEVSSEDKN